MIDRRQRKGDLEYYHIAICQMPCLTCSPCHMLRVFVYPHKLAHGDTQLHYTSEMRHRDRKTTKRSIGERSDCNLSPCIPNGPNLKMWGSRQGCDIVQTRIDSVRQGLDARVGGSDMHYRAQDAAPRDRDSAMGVARSRALGRECISGRESFSNKSGVRSN